MLINILSNYQTCPLPLVRLKESIKGTGHYWYLLKIIINIKTYWVTSNGELLIVQTIVRNGSLWNDIVFWERGNFSLKYYKTSGLKLSIMRLKAHKFALLAGTYFFHYFLATLMTTWVQPFTDLFIYAYVGIHQVKTLVFDNYQLDQRYPLPLS